MSTSNHTLEDTLRDMIREIVLEELPLTPIGPPPPLLSAEEVGERLGVDRQTVYRMKKEGTLKGVNISDQRFRFHPDEVDRFIREGGKVSRSGGGQ